MQRSRDLLWDGLLNVRDLGGHPTEDGGETRYDSIIRADSVRQLSDQGWAALVDYGVKTIVDLRTNDELAADPPAELPVEVLHIPFFETDADDWKEVEARLEAITRSAAGRAVGDARGLPDLPRALQPQRSGRDPRDRETRPRAEWSSTAPAARIAPGCSPLSSCTWQASASDEIAADYALSEERLRPRHEQWFAEAETEEELERMKRMSQTPAESIEGVFEELERRHGSVEGYLRACWA